MIRDENVFTIQEISQALDIPKSTLRYWEKAIPQIRPQRTGGGQRRYTRDHIRLFENVVALKGRGMGLAQIRQAFGPMPETGTDLLSSRQFEHLTQQIVETVREEIRTYLCGLNRDQRKREIPSEKSTIPDSRADRR